MEKRQLTGAGILSGLLLIAAWPVSPLTPLIFIAWIPLLVIADNTTKRIGFLSYAFLAILIWNTGTTWWMWNSTDVGTIAAIIANSLLMCLPWWGYHIFKNRYGKRTGYAALVCGWMAFEYLHLNWQLSWPWLTLGNVFALHPGWVQWYEYTGVSAGSLWILVGNILLFEAGKKIRNNEKKNTLLITCAAVFLLPLLLSFLVTPRSTEPKAATTTSNVVIVQPNIDPYHKFDISDAPANIDLLIRLSESAIDSSTRLVLWPETAMSVGEWQDDVVSNAYYRPVFNFTGRHPQLVLVSGIDTRKFYGPEKLTPTALKISGGGYYDAFNASVVIKATRPLQFYNKSKLVPGVESLPTFLNFMAPVFEKFGGTTGGYGRSDSAAVFKVEGNPYSSAPIICYESIYGEYVGSYIQKGANLLTIMTNDGWWGNTPGHRQHLHYARLRAVETRKWVARSANTGISAVIDPNGNIVASQPWDKAAVIKYNIPVTGGETFYVRFGDYLYKIAAIFTLLLALWHLVSMIGKKINYLRMK